MIGYFKEVLKTYGWALGILILVSSCNSTKYLQEGETFLVENKLEINSPGKIEDKSNIKKNLNKQIQQQPNGRAIYIFPKEWIYFKNSGPGDSSWYNNFFLKYMAEPPAIFQEEKARQSAYDMQNYLVNKKGFYNAKVGFSFNTTPPITEVKYEVNTGKRFKINSIEYFGNDKAVISEMESIRAGSIIKPGDPIDAASFDLELTRLSLALQNKGYANFATNFFTIKGDSTVHDNAVDIFLELRPPLPDSFHTQFTVGDVNVYTDYHRNQITDKLDTATYLKTIFHKQSDKFLVKPSTISQRIFLKEGNLYNRDARTKTRKKLSELETYRFVTMNGKIDEVHDSVINYDILLTPYTNKWVANYGSDFFFSTINQQNRRLFGFSLNTQFKNRNFLGGAEQLTIGTETGLELQVNPDVQIRTVSAGLSAALEIPKQNDLFKLASTMKAIGVIGDKRYKNFKENTTTTIGGGYNFVNVFDSYSRSSFNASYTYNFRPSQNKRWNIRQLGLEYNDYELKEEFLDDIGNNQLLLRSFEDNLLTGLFFRDVKYLYTKPVNNKGYGFTFIGGFEVSGWETYIANKIYNAAASSSEIWKLNNNIGFSKFFRIDLDPRIYKFFSPKHSLVFRGYGGIGIPYGGDITLPYFKQFSVGGPNSLRGWDQKELGPGAHSLLLENPPEDGQTFYQSGDLKIEFNLEYRFDIIWYFEGAFFIDAGNVWVLKEDIERPGAKFTSDFLDQFAVSTGYGIRLDFDYFNIRFDFGYKLRKPYDFEGEKRQWYNWSEIKSQNIGNFQVAVNYPF